MTHAQPSSVSPSFSGPYAKEFAEEYRLTRSARVRAILTDGVISDSEWAEVKADYITCLARHGVKMTLDGEGAGGTATTTRPHVDQTAAQNACNYDMAFVSNIRVNMIRNPKNEDMDVLVARCLVGVKLVGPEYSVKDYRKESDADNLSFDASSQAAVDCVNDPQGLLAAKGGAAGTTHVPGR